MGFKPIFEQERQFFKEKTGIEIPLECWRNGSKIYLDFTQPKPLLEFKVENKQIIITKDNRNGYKQGNKTIKLPKQKTVEELIEIYKENLNTLYKESYLFLYKYLLNNLNRKFVLSHSGGKDSSLMYYIFCNVINDIKQYKNITVDYKINFSNTSNDTADTYKTIKKLPNDKLVILNPKEGFYQWIKRKNYLVPTALMRNCCSTYKEGQVNKYYDKAMDYSFFIGVRKHESTKRQNYTWIMNDEFYNNLFGEKNSNPKRWENIAPIIEWKDEYVWLFLLDNKIELNPQYYLGFNRCGCLICPYQSDYVDLLIEKHYPNLWNRWVNDILPKSYTNTHIQERYKWTLEEYQSGKWKTGTSKIWEITKNKPTPERIKQVAEIMGITEDIALRYFNRKCCICGKKLNPTDIAMNMKILSREIDNEHIMCKKHFCEKTGISTKDYKDYIQRFREGGCSLF